MSKEVTSWKDKVDPALADQVKAFVEFLKLSEEPDYENSEELLIRSLVVSHTMLITCLLKRLFVDCHVALLMTSLVIENIKNSSIKSFKIFYEGKEEITLLVDFFKSMSSVDVSGIEHDIKKQELFAFELEQKITPEMILYITFSVLNLVSTLIDKKSLKTLYEEARDGNETSLFTLIRYDKTLFDHEWFRERILKEMLLSNSIFFEKLGDAIKSEPLISKHGQVKLKFILFVFWDAVFSKLTYKQQIELLDYIGVEVPVSFDGYKKLIKREITPLFKKN